MYLKILQKMTINFLQSSLYGYPNYLAVHTTCQNWDIQNVVSFALLPPGTFGAYHIIMFTPPPPPPFILLVYQPPKSLWSPFSFKSFLLNWFLIYFLIFFIFFLQMAFIFT